mmetsp:Transcript_19156/g.55570  ORF Transcript_19156/g.55570 Transcript_19156/m.55570 type:complete len:497 (+) Transcript_19156:476-1966(+)
MVSVERPKSEASELDGRRNNGHECNYPSEDRRDTLGGRQGHKVLQRLRGARADVVGPPGTIAGRQGGAIDGLFPSRGVGRSHVGPIGLTGRGPQRGRGGGGAGPGRRNRRLQRRPRRRSLRRRGTGRRGGRCGGGRRQRRHRSHLWGAIDAPPEVAVVQEHGWRREDTRALRVAIHKRVRGGAKLGVVPAQDVIRCLVDGALAMLRDVLATEALRMLADPTDDRTDDRRRGGAVGDATRLGIHAHPAGRRPCELGGHLGEAQVTGSVGEPVRELVQPSGTSLWHHRRAEVLSHLAHEADHFPLVAGVQSSLIATLVQRDVGMGAHRDVVNAFAPVHLRHRIRQEGLRRLGGRIGPLSHAIQCVCLPEVRHLRHLVHLAEAEHAEFLLRTALPICDLILEEGDTEEQRKPLRDLHCLGQVRKLVRRPLVVPREDMVVLADVHRGPWQLLGVIVQKLDLQVRGGIRCVKAVGEPRSVRLGNVVLRSVPILPRVVNRVV